MSDKEVWVIDLTNLPSWLFRNKKGQLEINPSAITSQQDTEAIKAYIKLSSGLDLSETEKLELRETMKKSNLLQAFLMAVLADKSLPQKT